jgi:hypothetical protein
MNLLIDRKARLPSGLTQSSANSMSWSRHRCRQRLSGRLWQIIVHRGNLKNSPERLEFGQTQKREAYNHPGCGVGVAQARHPLMEWERLTHMLAGGLVRSIVDFAGELKVTFHRIGVYRQAGSPDRAAHRKRGAGPEVHAATKYT